jgi:single-stranded-DNA-specific exonuclease
MCTSSSSAGTEFLEGSGGRRWRIRPTPDIAAFAGASWPPLISVLLTNRSITNLPAAIDYLGEPRELTDPGLMPNLEVAVERLEEACTASETVAIFGDFDVDGLTSTTILTEGLRELGARPLPYVPDRFSEGYGPNAQAIRELHRQGASVLVTADCGTSALREIELANELGMDVIVIDHHTAPDDLPDALALVNPKLHDSQYGSEPAAVGVAHKVMHVLYERSGREFSPDEHYALVALGTICDLAPMQAENRDLVRIGLRALAKVQRPGLRALAETAKVDLREADAEMCGWQLGPRLNAAGRMAHARTALELLLTNDQAEARRLAIVLDSLNRQRRKDTDAALEEVEASLTSQELSAPLIIFGSETISQGIIGLVAARLVELHHRPAIVLQLIDGEGRASCRSIDAFDITALLRRHDDLFLRYGGHRAAAGFSIDLARLPEVSERLVADAAERLMPGDLSPILEVETELQLTSVNGELLRWLNRLGPHGIGNPRPRFLARKVRIFDSRTVGADGLHLQFTLKEGRVTWRAIAFRNAAHAVPSGDLADIVYTFSKDNLRGTLQLEVLDLRPAR